MKFVDLGLPSGTYWATYNLGTKKYYRPGKYYAWGETKTKKVYNSKTYKVGNKIKCYNTNDVLIANDDISTVKLGKQYRIPTIEEWRELIHNCDKQYIKDRRINGYKLIGKNGNYIFIPCAGNRKDDRLEYFGHGYYWSSTCFDKGAAYCVYLFNDYDFKCYSCAAASYGFSIRPICNNYDCLSDETC